MAVGVFLFTVLAVVGGVVLYQSRDAKIDVSPPSFLSDEDAQILTDPDGGEKAVKKSYEKWSREAASRANTQGPPAPTWQGGWKK